MRKQWWMAATWAVASAAIAQEAGAPTLAGERFTALVTPVREVGTVYTGPIEECDEAGTSRFQFHADGPATGPYPGTFSEDAMVVIAPQAPLDVIGPRPTGEATFTARFEIDSPLGRVTGTKTGIPPLPGTCAQFEVAPGRFASARQVNGLVTYDAIIEGPDGRVRVSGIAELNYRDAGGAAGDNVGFNETFLTSEVVPLSTPGSATGGGQVGDATFAFEVTSRDRGEEELDIHGHCNVVDAGLHVRCVDAVSYVQSGNVATFTGNALVDGAASTYRITVVDGGEGVAGDTFEIETSAGYSAGGPVTEGNVQVHDQE